MKEKENTNVPLVIGATKSLKSFKRSTCSSDFKSKQSLKKHIENIHEGKKLFGCTICNARFHLKIDANRHIEITHEGKIAFSCPICDYRFFS